MLAHFDRVSPMATDLHEPLYQNLFEVTFQFPTILNLSDKDMEIMMLSTSDIELDLTKPLETAVQKFKFSERLYLKTPESTAIKDMSMNFYINVDDKFSMRTWNYMKKWYDLGWNSQTGELHYKREMVGTITGHIHDRKGVVIRRVEFKNVQCKGIQSMKFSWDGNDIISGQANFCADHWIDQYFDINDENR